MGKRAREGADSAEPSPAVKKKPKKPRKHAGDPAAADAVAGASGEAWQPVEAGEDFHTGLDEDGFMGLEVQEAPKLFSPSTAAAAAANDAAAAAAHAKAGKNAGKAAKAAKVAEAAVTAPDSAKQKQKKRRKADAADAAGSPDAPAQPAAAAAPDAGESPAAPAAAPGAATPAAAAAGGGIDDEVAAALRAKAAEKEKRRQEVLPNWTRCCTSELSYDLCSLLTHSKQLSSTPFRNLFTQLSLLRIAEPGGAEGGGAAGGAGARRVRHAGGPLPQGATPAAGQAQAGTFARGNNSHRWRSTVVQCIPVLLATRVVRPRGRISTARSSASCWPSADGCRHHGATNNLCSALAGILLSAKHMCAFCACRRSTRRR